MPRDSETQLRDLKVTRIRRVQNLRKLNTDDLSTHFHEKQGKSTTIDLKNESTSILSLKSPALRQVLKKWYSYETLSPRSTFKVETQKFSENIRHKHNLNTTKTLQKLEKLHGKDLKINFDYHMLAQRMQGIREFEVSRE